MDEIVGEPGIFLGRVTFPRSQLCLALYSDGWKCENPGSGLELKDVVAVLNSAFPARHGSESVSGAASYLEGSATFATPSGADLKLEPPRE